MSKKHKIISTVFGIGLLGLMLFIGNIVISSFDKEGRKEYEVTYNTLLDSNDKSETIPSCIFHGYGHEMPDTCLLPVSINDFEYDGGMLSFFIKNTYISGNHLITKKGDTYLMEKSDYYNMVEGRKTIEVLKIILLLVYGAILSVIVYIIYQIIKS